jgi:hypothetical protein
MNTVPFIPQATSFKAYTPAAGVLPWQYCTFWLSEDANVTGTDYDGNELSAVPLKAGYQPILMKTITTVSTGVVRIMRHSELS